MERWLKRARSLHYSFSAPQLSSAASNTRTVPYTSAASSACALSLSRVEDSDPHHVTSPPPSLSASALAFPAQSPQPQSSGRHLDSPKQDDEAFLARVDVNRANSPLGRDVSEVSVPKVVCVSIFTVICCVLGMQLAVHKMSGLDESALITAFDGGNATEAALDLEKSEDNGVEIVLEPYKRSNRANGETPPRAELHTAMSTPVPSVERQETKRIEALSRATLGRSTVFTSIVYGDQAAQRIRRTIAPNDVLLSAPGDDRVIRGLLSRSRKRVLNTSVILAETHLTSAPGYKPLNVNRSKGWSTRRYITKKSPVPEW
ncbi:hypothetical protein V5799_018716 [Amblyomma americanum]|uniref:Uncharacterized protein n=1 Tax=Amblyomma americanum TaxID=6943 RepID=A0AAQ4EYG5_AMBAM